MCFQSEDCSKEPVREARIEGATGENVENQCQLNEPGRGGMPRAVEPAKNGHENGEADKARVIIARRNEQAANYRTNQSHEESHLRTGAVIRVRSINRRGKRDKSGIDRVKRKRSLLSVPERAEDRRWQIRVIDGIAQDFAFSFYWRTGRNGGCVENRAAENAAGNGE